MKSRPSVRGECALRCWPNAGWRSILAVVAFCSLAGCGSDARRTASPRQYEPPPLAAAEPPKPAEAPPPVDAPGFPFRGLPVSLEAIAGKWTTEPAFPALRFDDPVSFVQAPRTNTIFVSEREGRIYSFERHEDVALKTLVLDISARNQGEADCGLLGLVFHPQYGLQGSKNSGYVYLHYAFSQTPIVGVRPERNPSLRSRLSRLEFDAATGLIDPKSELILIDQRDDNLNHQGGAMFFGPKDGFLYLTVGDEGDCALKNCQRIDKDLYSGVLRIDVDMQGGAVSHPIPRQPQTGTTANYFIPNDNPFVGQPGVLEEFYAVGLRSPHRMTYDPVDGLAWIGDVGEGMREEVDVLAKAGNYQWPAFEGRSPVPAAIQRAPLPLPDPPPGIWTDPIVDFGRDEIGAVIGGYVYRGTRLPQLAGRYIFADYMLGGIWALSYQLQAGRPRPVELEMLVKTPFNMTSGGITSFGTDSDAELYFLTIGQSAQVRRLIASETSTNTPLRLSQVATSAGGASPASYVVRAYDVRSPLWSDGAHKRRWFALPEGSRDRVLAERSLGFPGGDSVRKALRNGARRTRANSPDAAGD